MGYQCTTKGLRKTKEDQADTCIREVSPAEGKRENQKNIPVTYKYVYHWAYVFSYMGIYGAFSFFAKICTIPT
ncbi:hypothetical protein K435DRAFT_78077 [Dendrothele bispora CBS 962.96]|uniref:Uncharacterized protein n=1 Tax=Dendrothele bispora (strain CBS 962.96) TaxID=1314807 RepID=A0A4S8KQ23_DENBC|nr:hypothetical protein K435DRAFT_78077 [Dendrothele bispora CBS 962.96]